MNVSTPVLESLQFFGGSFFSHRIQQLFSLRTKFSSKVMEDNGTYEEYIQFRQWWDDFVVAMKDIDETIVLKRTRCDASLSVSDGVIVVTITMKKEPFTLSFDARVMLIKDSKKPLEILVIRDVEPKEWFTKDDLYTLKSVTSKEKLETIMKALFQKYKASQ